MTKFVPRKSAPSKNDKNFINYAKGGYNTAIIIDKKTGYVLPNCVGYAQGRVLEQLGAKKVNWKLPACNAEDWYETAKNNGLPTGLIPKLGAPICWKSGKTHNAADGAGHVGVVEGIDANGDLDVSNSARNGKEFYMTKVKKSDGYNYNGKEFQGFIYTGIEYDDPTPAPTPQPKKSNTEIAKEVIAGKWGTGNDRKTKLQAAGYDYAAIQKEVDALMKPAAPKSYNVKVIANALNIRKGPGTNNAVCGCIRDKGVYTIVETKNNWGKLKSGAGWICLDYTKKC